MQITKKGNAVFDYTKFVLSIMIVALHTRFLADIVSPWLRLAVPLFFIIMSYFFFSKIRKLDNIADKNNALYNFTKRKLYLYIFWTIVLLPVILYIRREAILTKGILYNVIVLIRDAVFHGTFSASWFIMASIIATIIVYFLS